MSDIDECVSNPCQNEGLCVDGVNAYTCECSSGYSGVNCETSEYLFQNVHIAVQTKINLQTQLLHTETA